VRLFFAQSERGNRFAERLMAIAPTARKQSRDILSFRRETARSLQTTVRRVR